jgi:hypothetical protein
MPSGGRWEYLTYIGMTFRSNERPSIMTGVGQVASTDEQKKK